MLFFVAILALAVVSMLMVRAMALAGINPASVRRAPRVKAHRAPAAHPLDGAALRGLY